MVAFSRADEVITVVPRLVLGLGAGWGDTALELPPGRWMNRLTEESDLQGAVRIGRLLQSFPVALLARQG